MSKNIESYAYIKLELTIWQVKEESNPDILENLYSKIDSKLYNIKQYQKAYN